MNLLKTGKSRIDHQRLEELALMNEFSDRKLLMDYQEHMMMVLQNMMTKSLLDTLPLSYYKHLKWKNHYTMPLPDCKTF